MPFYDEDAGVLYLGGKGDSNVRFFEVDVPAATIYALGEFTTAHPQLGLAMLPKLSCDPRVVEVARFFKLTATQVRPPSPFTSSADWLAPIGRFGPGRASTVQVLPISFKVPRLRTEYFQDDLYRPLPPVQHAPTSVVLMIRFTRFQSFCIVFFCGCCSFPDTFDWQPSALSSAQWASGANAERRFVSMQPDSMVRLSAAPPPPTATQGARRSVTQRELVRKEEAKPDSVRSRNEPACPGAAAQWPLLM